MITVSNVSLQFGGNTLFKNVELKFTNGKCYGSMLLKLPKDTEEAKQAAAYMRSQPGVTVEEVTGE